MLKKSSNRLKGEYDTGQDVHFVYLKIYIFLFYILDSMSLQFQSKENKYGKE